MLSPLIDSSGRVRNAPEQDSRANDEVDDQALERERQRDGRRSGWNVEGGFARRRRIRVSLRNATFVYVPAGLDAPRYSRSGDPQSGVRLGPVLGFDLAARGCSIGGQPGTHTEHELVRERATRTHEVAPDRPTCISSVCGRRRIGCRRGRGGYRCQWFDRLHGFTRSILRSAVVQPRGVLRVLAPRTRDHEPASRRSLTSSQSAADVVTVLR